MDLISTQHMQLTAKKTNNVKLVELKWTTILKYMLRHSRLF